MPKKNIQEVVLSRLLKNGYSIGQISKELSVSRKSVVKGITKLGMTELANKNGEIRQKNNRSKQIPKEILEPLIMAGLSAEQIANQLSVTYPTVLKYGRRFGFGAALEKNARARQASSLYKDGRSVYRKHKKQNCEHCGSKASRLEVHHKKPVTYDENWSVIISGDHSPSNLITLCNSCHQKTHYKEHGRVPMKSDGRKFYSHEY